MTTYEIRNRDTDATQDVEAESFEDAVRVAYETEYKSGYRGVVGIRQTGTPGMSGVFAAYRPGPQQNGMSKVGPNRGYHVARPGTRRF